MWGQRIPPVQCSPAGWFSAEAVQTVRWSSDDRIIACAGFDGMLNGVDAKSGKRLWQADCNQVRLGKNPSSPTTDRKKRDPIPITCVRWRPGQRHVVLVGRSNGSILHWDTKEDRCITAWEEDDNEVYTMDITRNGSKLVTAGEDSSIRVWDMGRGEVETHLHVKDDFEVLPHSLRVYAVKCSRDDDNIIVSAGWEDNVRLWDLRAPKPCVKSFFGPHITGEGLDIHGPNILTASHRTHEQLEVWDLGSGKKASAIGDKDGDYGSMLNGCQFSRQGSFIAVAGGGGLGLKNVATVLERRSTEQAGAVPDSDLPKAVLCCDFSYQGDAVAYGDGKGMVHIMDIKKR
eukprot:Hpha_TRINITY_DN9082_c0_g1::TRINITY_DN9082_c0_g1_i1::g.141710::m.141710